MAQTPKTPGEAGRRWTPKCDALEARVVPAFPIAVGDNVPVNAGEPVTFNPLDNDPYADQLNLTWFGQVPATQGVLARNDDGTFTFTPSSKFTGASFDYTIKARVVDSQLGVPLDDLAAGSALGSSVVMSADGNTAVIAAPDAAGGNTGRVAAAGSVFVFGRTADGWALKQRLFASGDPLARLSTLESTPPFGGRPDPDLRAAFDFGAQVAVSADGKVIAVADPNATAGGLFGGAVYVFTLGGAGYSTPVKIAAPLGTGDVTGFGTAVALSGDGTVLAIGSPNSDGGTDGAVGDAGSVFVYRRAAGGGFSGESHQRLFARADSTATVSSDFGRAIAISNDGKAIVVGDPSATGGADGAAAFAGAAYLFETEDGVGFTKLPVKLFAQGIAVAAGEEQFGTAVAISGDGSTIAVGAPNGAGGDTGTVEQAGSVYVYRRDPAGDMRVDPQRLYASGDSGFGNDFGRSVALSENGTVLVVGDPDALGGDTAGVPTGGAAYVYRRASSYFAEEPTLRLTSLETVTGDRYGTSVSVSADGFSVLAGSAGATFADRVGAGTVSLKEIGSANGRVQLTRAGATSAQDRFLVGGSPDGTVRQYTFDASGVAQVGQVFRPFDIRGDVRTAVGDIDGDGVADFLFGVGAGVGSSIRGISGKNQADLFPTFDAFESSFKGGVFLAAGDIDGDGRAELVVSPDVGGGGRIQVFGLRDGKMVQLANFLGIEDGTFRGGARVAVGDFSGDGKADIGVAAGFGGGPRVALFDGSTVVAPGGKPARLLGDFFAFAGTEAKSLRNGVFISAGDLDGDGRADLVIGGGPGGGPRVMALSGAALLTDMALAQNQPLANFFAGDAANRGGARVLVKDANGDGKGEIVVGSGEKVASKVSVYTHADLIASGSPSASQTMDPVGMGNNPFGVFVG